MVTVGLFVRLTAQLGKEAQLETFLRDALPLAQAEPATTVWFALRFGPADFAIFDAFPDEHGRRAHLAGRIATALGTKAADLLAAPPVVEYAATLAAKLPRE